MTDSIKYLEDNRKTSEWLSKLCLKCGLKFKLSDSLGICKSCLDNSKKR